MFAALLCIATIGAAACGSTQPSHAAPHKTGKNGGAAVVVTNRLIELSSGINMGSIKDAQKKLLKYDQESNEPIWIRINSPGGSVDAGLILIDTMHAVKSPTYCIVESKAYSMGAIILTFCDKRYGYPHATFMLHEASYGTVGDDLSNRSKMDFLTTYLDRVHVEIAGRLNMDVKAYRAKIRDAWWLLADEAKKVGLIHEIITDMKFYEYPVEKTEDKRTVTFTAPDPGDTATKIPKRRD